MQFKLEPRESFPQCLLYAFGIINMLHHTDKIICITHNVTCSSCLRLYFLFKPKRYDPLETQPAERLDLLLRLEFEVVVISENSIQSLVKTILDTNLPPGYSAQSQSIDIRHLTKPLLGESETWRWRVRARRDIVAHLTHTEVINLSLGLTPQEAGDRLHTDLKLADRPVILITPSWWPRLPILPFRILVRNAAAS